MNNNNLNKIEILKDFLERDMKKPLELFSLFISSNPDFKYNITYLTDQIEIFKKSREELKDRFDHFEHTITLIKKDTPDEVKGYLIFDNVFSYGINKDEEDHLTFINLDTYRFDKIDAKNYIAKFILGDKKNPQKIETYKIDRVKDIDIESKIEINELWASFIE